MRTCIGGNDIQFSIYNTAVKKEPRAILYIKRFYSENEET